MVRPGRVRKGPRDARRTYAREGGVTTVIVGTASRSVIEDYISSLTTRPGRAAQNGAGSSSTGVTTAAGGELCVLVDLAVGAPLAYGAPGAVRAGTRVPLGVDVPVARRGGDVGADRFGQPRLLEVPRIDLAGVRRQHLDLDRGGRAAVRLSDARGQHRQQERDLQVVGIDVVGAAGRQGPGGLDLARHEPVADAEHEIGLGDGDDLGVVVEAVDRGLAGHVLDAVGGERAARDMVPEVWMGDRVVGGVHDRRGEADVAARSRQVGVAAADTSGVRRLEPGVDQEAAGLGAGVVLVLREVGVRGQEPLGRAALVAVEVGRRDGALMRSP